jgi:hypothetical protein
MHCLRFMRAGGFSFARDIWALEFACAARRAAYDGGHA